MKSTLLLVCFINSIHARSQFQKKIPNGDIVPHPGPQGGVWAGVGYFQAGGSGSPLNPFGEAFRDAGFVWTTELCQADSDGDGRSNGEELGDPDCLWMADSDDDDLLLKTGLSHPGIVDEPLESPPANFCSDYDDGQPSFDWNVGFSEPVTLDGSSRTEYICEQQMVPTPADDAEVLHLIKSAMKVDNEDVLHHAFLYICNDAGDAVGLGGGGSSDGNKIGEGPYACSGNESRCSRIAGWAVGASDTCLPAHVGLELQFAREQENVWIKIEAHYDNPSGVAQRDQSGFAVTLTDELRPLVVGLSIHGVPELNNDFELPGGQSQVRLSAICPTQGTSKLNHPLYAFQFTPHMHLLGRSLITEHYRCGKKIGTLGEIDSYEFDYQQSYAWDPPIQILPGDALVTHCVFDTSSTPEDATILGGEESTDEMCFNFVSYYPLVEDRDGLFEICTAFEHGIRLNSEASADDGRSFLSNSRFAYTGGGAEGFLLNFDSDPTTAWHECCDTESCDTFFDAGPGGACGVDSNCVDDLVCRGGLCEEGEQVSNAGPVAEVNSSPSFGTSQYRARTTGVLLAVVFGVGIIT